MSKKYEELRPFDLEALKRGEKVCWYADGEVAVEVFFVRDQAVPVFETSLQECQCGVFSLSECSEYFRMAPLCWVEDRPVYKGDVLYSEFFEGTFVASGYRPGHDGAGYIEASGISQFANTKLDACTWTPPKVKREGWVNVYGIGYMTHLYEGKKEADENASDKRKACIRIEWEEA